MREFVVAKNKKLCGSVFHSNTPSSAARKAFNELCGKQIACHKVIKVIDTEKDKVYKYKVTRTLANKTVIIAGNPVLFKFSTKVESLKK